MSAEVVPRERPGVVCGECGAVMKLRYTEKFRRYFYGCSRYPKCVGVHGAHPDGRPLGIPGDRATKDARIAAHDAFDRLWKSGRMTRTEAYKWLRLRLALSRSKCHIGAFDASRCAHVVRLVASELGPESAVVNPSNRPVTKSDMLADAGPFSKLFRSIDRKLFPMGPNDDPAAVLDQIQHDMDYSGDS